MKKINLKGYLAKTYKKIKIFIKYLKIKLNNLEKPMITWNKIAIEVLTFIHLLNNLVILLLAYKNDNLIVIILLYLLISNLISFKCLERLWR